MALVLHDVFARSRRGTVRSREIDANHSELNVSSTVVLSSSWAGRLPDCAVVGVRLMLPRMLRQLTAHHATNAGGIVQWRKIWCEGLHPLEGPASLRGGIPELSSLSSSLGTSRST